MEKVCPIIMYIVTVRILAIAVDAKECDVIVDIRIHEKVIQTRLQETRKKYYLCLYKVL